MAARGEPARPARSDRTGHDDYTTRRRRGLLETRTTRSYDERGLLKESIADSGHGAVEQRAQSERTFDAHGNWIVEWRSRWSSGGGHGGACHPRGETTSLTYRALDYDPRTT